MNGETRSIINQPKDSSILSSLISEDKAFFSNIENTNDKMLENAFDYIMSRYLGETSESCSY